MISEASSASVRVISRPPVTLTITSCAPSIVVSRSGEKIALRAASVIRSSPEPIPIPIRALPLFAITVLTSAKSRLIRPGLVIKSVIPWTP